MCRWKHCRLWSRPSFPLPGTWRHNIHAVGLYSNNVHRVPRDQLYKVWYGHCGCSDNHEVASLTPIFTALHAMQTRSSDENSVRPSVRPSNACIANLWQIEERFVQIFIPYERPFCLVFWEEEWLVGVTPSTWNFGQSGRVGAKSPIFNRYSLVAASAVTPNEKSLINTNRKATTRFPMSPRWTSYVVPKPAKGERAQKRKNGRFPSKIALCLKKVCYKVSLCGTVSEKVVGRSLA